jgi:tryptophan synthase alpha chain
VLEAEIRKRRAKQDILLMTHIVLGYPSFDACRRIVEQMVQAGVDLMELQIPFSEPIADGPVILHANQKALEAGATVDRCFELAQQLASEFPIPFLFMTYYNIVFQRGLERFANQTRDAGLRGAIVPDLPLEEGAALFDAMEAAQLAPVFIYSPSTSSERMRIIAQRARGFVYCVARKGVTGAATEFTALPEYLARCRSATTLPLALGFGVKDRHDVAALVGQVDIAVIGSETVRVVDQHGVPAVREFIAGLR